MYGLKQPSGGLVPVEASKPVWAQVRERGLSLLKMDKGLGEYFLAAC